MKRVLIAYFSVGGITEQMAQYIAEGVRISGHEAVIKSMESIGTDDELAGYDGYIFGSPTYSLDVPEPVRKFLATAGQAGIQGKPGGAFGSYTHDVAYRHDNLAPAIIFDELQSRLGMTPFELGPFALQEDKVDTSEGIQSCQDYGRIFGERLGA